MKERIFTTKEQGRVLVEAGLPISTAIGFRDKYLDQLHSMEDDAGRVGLIEAVTPDVFNPVWDVGTLLNLLPYEIDGSTFECSKLIDNEKYHLSGIEYVAKRYQDMFYAGRDIYYFKGMGERGITNLLRNAIDDLLDTISSRETYRSAEHRMYAQMNKLTEAGAMISLAIELLTSNIRHSYGEINFERYPRPVEVEGEDKH